MNEKKPTDRPIADRMSAQEAWEIQHKHSGEASKIARAIGLAGLAIVWIFRDQSGAVPPSLFLPSMLLVAGLSLDLAQYVILAEHWRAHIYSRRQEKDPDLRMFRGAVAYSYWIWRCKVLFVCIAYIWLFVHLSLKLWPD